MPLPRLTARQPWVAIVATWVATSLVMLVVHWVGGGSAGMTTSIIGSPRANHSATMSNSAWVYSVAAPRGIAASAWNIASWVGPSVVPNARLKT